MTTTDPAASDTAQSATARLFSTRGFPATYAVGVVWSLCRWAIGFLGAYVVNDLTGSPRLVQLTGALLWAPLLFAGVAGGVLSDRFPRRLLLLIQFGVLGPATAGIGFLALADRLPLWLLYLYMVTAGGGWVIDMTVRRALVHDFVGDTQVDRAMAFEGLASALGLAVGAFAGGALIGAFGAGGAYLAVAGAIALAAALLLLVPSTPGHAEPSAAMTGTGTGSETKAPPAESFVSLLVGGLKLAGRLPVLASILGVTALTNFFHFSYFPIVPVIADRVDATPVATGALAAATGLGMAVGALVILTERVPRGPAYATGAAGAFTFLLGFALFDTYALVFASLFLASSFVGLFAATQSALVLRSVEPAMKGRAMGLLLMAIGMLPLGMAALGEAAEVFGAPTALVGANLIGLAGLGLYLSRRPEVLRLP
ncbi:MAG: MFS transporter [Actinomycetota bacterium]